MPGFGLVVDVEGWLLNVHLTHIKLVICGKLTECDSQLGLSPKLAFHAL